MKKWYYIDENNQSQGPHEEEKIIELLQDGYLNAQTLVWADGIGFGGEWAMVSTVPDLSNSIKPLPPEPPPPPPPPPVPEPPPATDEYVEVEADGGKTSMWEKMGTFFLIIFIFLFFAAGGVVYLAFSDKEFMDRYIQKHSKP